MNYYIDNSGRLREIPGPYPPPRMIDCGWLSIAATIAMVLSIAAVFLGMVMRFA